MVKRDIWYREMSDIPFIRKAGNCLLMRIVKGEMT